MLSLRTPSGLLLLSQGSLVGAEQPLIYAGSGSPVLLALCTLYAALHFGAGQDVILCGS